jgi:hypothetical protein
MTRPPQAIFVVLQVPQASALGAEHAHWGSSTGTRDVHGQVAAVHSCQSRRPGHSSDWSPSQLLNFGKPSPLA